MLGLYKLSSDCIHFLSYSHSVAKTMHGRIYGRFIEREKKKHLREETRKYSRISGKLKGQIDVNSHEFKGRSHHVCVFFWGSVGAGKALHHLNSMLTILHLQQRGDNGLSKCKMYI